MFFNIGAGEMLLIAIVLLIAVGPEQLPGVIRKVGRTMGQLKSMSDRLRDDFMTGMNQIEEATDVKSWADKLETPWAEPIDNSSWAKNIDPPFTARRAETEESTGSQDVAPDTAEPEATPPPEAGTDGAEPGRGVGQGGSIEAADAVQPGTMAPLGDEPVKSTNGHGEQTRSKNGTDEARDPMAEERE